MPPDQIPEIVVNVETPPEPVAPLGEALEIARAIAKSDEILGDLRGLYAIVREALVKIEALEMALNATRGQIDGVATVCGALLAQEIAEPEPAEIAEAVAEEVVEEVASVLETEAIPATTKAAPETAPPEEKKTRKRGFF